LKDKTKNIGLVDLEYFSILYA